MIIRPASSVNGRIRLPGDKSISHRAAMIAAMAEGETRIDNFAPGRDCESTLSCLSALGVDIRRDRDTVFVRGVGKTGFRQPSTPLDCGNSGTTMRLLAGILAGQDFEATLTGDTSLRQRPMQRIIEPLELMGAIVSSDDGRAPLTISGGRLSSINCRMPVASAQVKSCILLAGLNAEGDTTVVELARTRDHTENLLRWFGTTVFSGGDAAFGRIVVSGDDSLQANDLTIPGDISAAAFFIAAAACLPGSEITLPDVGVNPTRIAFLPLLEQIGVTVEMQDRREVWNEVVATVRVSSPQRLFSPPVVRGDAIAGLIDELPILAVLGTRFENGIEIRDAGELRHKETDRLAAVTDNLTRMGATVTEFDDGFRVEPSRLKGARINSFGDHRIAMAFAVAGLFADGETEIEGSECVGVSYPRFFETLASVVR